MSDLPFSRLYRRDRRVGAWILSAALMLVLAAPALAEDRHDHDRDRHEDHRPVRIEHRYSFEAWHGGRWFHGEHGGRAGWWWVVGGVWYF
ncbi:MAG TPA: hypothetical protein VMH36_16345, partial [Alphaproteobacteria bacterium]|nr:hypothetical protein [Alphaproteobacteria bacterium]